MSIPLIRGIVTLGIVGLISPLAAENPSDVEAVESLTFEPASSAFQDALTVSVRSKHPVHYTLDGAGPGPESERYTSPIQLTKSTRIRAKAMVPGEAEFPIIEATYLHLDPSLEAFSSPLPVLVIDNFGQGAIPNKRAESDFGGDGSGITRVPRQPAALFLFEPNESPGEPRRTRLTPDTMSLAARLGIRVRGMSSSYQPQGKQNYSLETWRAESNKSLDITPLGLPAESDWALYTPAEMDRALIRNVLAYELMRQMGHYATRTRFVEVFLNTDGDSVSRSDFSGFYVLMEKIKRCPDRVPIQKMSDDGQTGGWIVQCDRMDPIPVSGEGHPFHFHTAGPDGKKATSHGRGERSDDFPTEWNAYFNFHYPKGRKSTEAQRAAVTGWFDAFEEALYGPQFSHPETGYRSVIDVRSFIDHSILVNLTRNFDSLNLSTYLYRPDHDSRVFLNPPWDFDRAMGSNEWRDRGTDGMWGRERLWFPRLFADPEFNQDLIDRWQDLRQSTLSNTNILSIIESYEREITASVADAHFQRLQGEFSDDFGDEIAKSDRWSEELSNLRSWISDRLAWLDKQNVAPPTLSSTLASNGAYTVKITAPTGAEVYVTQDGSDPRQPSQATSAPVTMLTTGAAVRAIAPEKAPLEDWTRLDVDDSDWQQGQAGVGVNSRHQHLVQLQMEPSTQPTHALARFSFDLKSTQLELASLTLYMRYNDGFIAYLNGKEVASSNAPNQERTWPLQATKSRFVAYATQPEPFDLSHFTGLLKEGTNVLAIHGTGDRTFLQPELIGIPGSGSKPSISAQKYDSTMILTDPETVITARSLLRGRWSAPRSIKVGTLEP